MDPPTGDRPRLRQRSQPACCSGRLLSASAARPPARAQGVIEGSYLPHMGLMQHAKQITSRDVMLHGNEPAAAQKGVA